MITFINSFGKHFSFHFFQEYMYTFNKTLAFFVIIFLSNYFIADNKIQFGVRMEIILYIHVYSEPMVEMGINLSISNINC